MRLLELNRQSAVIGVTNTAGSPLARGAHLALLAQAGPEHSVSCKTYVSGMLILQWLAAIFAGREEHETHALLQPCADLAERYLTGWRSKTEVLAARLHGKRHLFLTGRGTSLSAVGTGALITKEAARVHAEGMSSAAFRHGPMEMQDADMWIGVFTGAEATRALNLRLARDLAESGAACDEIGPGAALAPFNLPECAADAAPAARDPAGPAHDAGAGRPLRPEARTLRTRLQGHGHRMMNATPAAPTRDRSALLVGLVFLTFFVISFVTNILGPLVPDIIRDFRVSQGMAGMLPFSFFIAYGVLSIPGRLPGRALGRKAAHDRLVPGLHRRCALVRTLAHVPGLGAVIVRNRLRNGRAPGGDQPTAARGGRRGALRLLFGLRAAGVRRGLVPEPARVLVPDRAPRLGLRAVRCSSSWRD